MRAQCGCLPCSSGVLHATGNYARMPQSHYCCLCQVSTLPDSNGHPAERPWPRLMDGIDVRGALGWVLQVGAALGGAHALCGAQELVQEGAVGCGGCMGWATAGECGAIGWLAVKCAIQQLGATCARPPSTARCIHALPFFLTLCRFPARPTTRAPHQCSACRGCWPAHAADQWCRTRCLHSRRSAGGVQRRLR